MFFTEFTSSKVDLFVTHLKNQLADYISWTPDPGAMDTRPWSHQLGRPKGLCLYPLLTNRQVPSEGQSGGEYNA